MNLASVIRETKDKTPDVIRRIKEMQAKDRLREIKARKTSSNDSALRGRLQRRGAQQEPRGLRGRANGPMGRGSLMPAIARPRRGKPTPSHRPQKLLGAGLLAGAVGYFLDPAEGGRRRGVAFNKISSVARRGGDHAAKPSELAGNPFEGTQAKVVGASVPVRPGALNDKDPAAETHKPQ